MSQQTARLIGSLKKVRGHGVVGVAIQAYVGGVREENDLRDVSAALQVFQSILQQQGGRDIQTKVPEVPNDTYSSPGTVTGWLPFTEQEQAKLMQTGNLSEIDLELIESHLGQLSKALQAQGFEVNIL